MEQTTIHYIKEAVRNLENCQLQGPKYKEAYLLLRKIRDILDFQDTDEAAIFSIAFTRMADGNYTNLSDIASHIGCSPIDILAYTTVLSRLSKSGYIQPNGRRVSNIIMQDFGIDDVVSSAIIENRPVEIKANVSNTQLSKYDFCEAIGKTVIEKAIGVFRGTLPLINRTAKLEDECPHLSFILNLKALAPDIQDRILFYDVCFDTFADRIFSDLNDTVSYIYAPRSTIYIGNHKRNDIYHSLYKGYHPLIKAGLIERLGKWGIVLTHKGMELFFEDDLSAVCPSLKWKDIYMF
ncbi:MAG: hypothetical protein MJZ15_08025 [Bacteroidales bacterium]|nr:hypothetical protein [Bacteroidales bacterium]